jgi:hypothetical protein
MNKKSHHLKTTLLVFIFIVLFSSGTGYSEDNANTITTVTPDSDMLLGQYEKENKAFTKLEIGDRIVYFHQRSIGDAVVEKDFTVYQFDKYTQNLIIKRVNRRIDIPKYIEPVISREQAVSMVGGDVLSARLLIISPESDVFPIFPTPGNPCWIVKHEENSSIILTVIDSVTGEKLGIGIPPPQDAYAFTGPTDSTPPCSGSWGAWVTNANNWFITLGYVSTSATWPTSSVIQSKVQDSHVELIYEFGHGGSTSFLSACQQYTTAQNIEDWMAATPRKAFAFLGHCDGMCNTGDDTLSYEYRKGSTVQTVTVGYCGMSTTDCDNCWWNSRPWQDRMFDYINQGYTVKDAFDMAAADYPMCCGCVRFTGDEDYTFKLNLPTIIFQVERKIESSWTVRKHYAKIDLTFENQDLLHFPNYKVYRKEVGGQYVEIREIASTGSYSESHTFLDHFPDKTKSYTYQAAILNIDGTIVKLSDEITI